MADSQQGVRHQSARDAAGTTDTYDGDLRALFNAVATVPAGSTFNEAFMLWLQSVTGSSADNINDLAALYASQQEDTYNWSSVGALGLPTLFDWEPETAEALPDTATFTRASVAQVLTTTDGTTNWYQLAESGELRYDGLRRVQNVVREYDTAAWTAGAGVTVTSLGGGEYEVTFPATTRITLGRSEFGFFPQGTPLVGSVEMKLISGTETRIEITDPRDQAASCRREVTLTSSYQRFQWNSYEQTTANTGFQIQAALNPVSAITIHFRNAQTEKIQTAGDVAGDYVEEKTTYNAGVSGVQYFNTTNSNSVDGSGVVTEAAGTTITGGGYLPETAATKRLLHSNDLTDAAWVKSGAAGAADLGITDIGGQSSRLTGIGALGVDDVAQTASGFTNNGSIAPSFLLKRVSTTGTLRLVQATDGATGGDWDIDLSAIGAGWVRIEPGSTLITENTAWTASAAGAAGVTFAASAGGPLSVDIAFVGQENTDFSTSPIITSGSTVTRAADTITDTTLFTTDWMWLVDVTNPLVLSGTRTMASGPSPSSYSINGSSQLVFSDQAGIPSGTVNTLAPQENVRAKYLLSYDFTNDVIFNGTDGDMLTGTNADEDWDGLNGHRIGGRTGATQYLGRIHNYILYGIAANDLSQAEDLVS